MGYILGKDSDSNGSIFMGVAFCITAIVITGLRLYARKGSKQGLKADDWIALSSLVSSHDPPTFVRQSSG